MQNKTQTTIFKVISLIVLIQGALQVLNVFGIIRYGASSLSVKFFLGLFLVGAYAIAAVVGGYTGLKNGDTYDGCRRCFYFGIVLVVVTIATMILNIVFKAYSVSQLEALIIPVAFMIFALLCERKK